MISLAVVDDDHLLVHTLCVGAVGNDAPRLPFLVSAYCERTSSTRYSLARNRAHGECFAFDDASRTEMSAPREENLTYSWHRAAVFGFATDGRALLRGTLNAFARFWEGERLGDPRHHPPRTEPRPPGITQGRSEVLTQVRLSSLTFCARENGAGLESLTYTARCRLRVLVGPAGFHRFNTPA
jgi:hypothetical protein